MRDLNDCCKDLGSCMKISSMGISSIFVAVLFCCLSKLSANRKIDETGQSKASDRYFRIDSLYPWLPFSRLEILLFEVLAKSASCC